MGISLVIWGLILDIFGVFILVMVSIWDPSYQKREDLKWWEKRYSWSGWRPIFKIRPPSKKAYWRIKLNCMVSTRGFMPPKHKWNTIGFLCVLIGFLLQILFYQS